MPSHMSGGKNSFAACPRLAPQRGYHLFAPYHEEFHLAKQTFTQLTDDLDGSEAVEEVNFAVRGVEYEIDLNAKNLAAFDKAFEKFIKSARVVPQARLLRSTTSRSRAKASTPREDVGAIREWARASGYEVSNRGRISASVREAYEAAQG
jgi:hypothetical protein